MLGNVIKTRWLPTDPWTGLGHSEGPHPSPVLGTWVLFASPTSRGSSGTRDIAQNIIPAAMAEALENNQVSTLKYPAYVSCAIIHDPGTGITTCFQWESAEKSHGNGHGHREEWGPKTIKVIDHSLRPCFTFPSPLSGLFCDTLITFSLLCIYTYLSF